MTPAFEFFQIIRRMIHPLKCIVTTRFMVIRLYDIVKNPHHSNTHAIYSQQKRKIRIEWEKESIMVRHRGVTTHHSLADPVGKNADSSVGLTKHLERRNE